MYNEKIKPILEDLENKEIDIAGGSVVGMVLSTVNSLIKYISNLTINKKKYEEVQEGVKEILDKAEILKGKSLQVIDEDRKVLENILKAYKARKENEEKYQQECKKATEFCLKVLDLAFDTLSLADEISKVGNRMLASDFKICKYYAFASVQSAIVNVEINVNSVNDKNYKKTVKNRCETTLEQAISLT